MVPLVAHDHVVRFFDDDREVVVDVAALVTDALARDERAVVVVTPEHRSALESVLADGGVDVARAQEEGSYRPHDAAETLAGFMVDDVPDAARFRATVGALLDEAAEGVPCLRVFGEMVALLWAEGNRDAALELEALWNALLADRRFSLLCAYPAHTLGAAPLGATNQVCAAHSRVLPPPSYVTGVPDPHLPDGSVVLVAVPEAVKAARRFVGEVLGPTATGELRDDVELVVSELATNAIKHASSAFRLKVSRVGPGVVVAVEDSAATRPREREVSPEDYGGRGVSIVGKVAARWGFDPLDDGKVVWAELATG